MISNFSDYLSFQFLNFSSFSPHPTLFFVRGLSKMYPTYSSFSKVQNQILQIQATSLSVQMHVISLFKQVQQQMYMQINRSVCLSLQFQYRISLGNSYSLNYRRKGRKLTFIKLSSDTVLGLHSMPVNLHQVSFSNPTRYSFFLFFFF